MKKRDVRGAVRIVFDRCDFSGDIVLVALEVYDTILIAVAAADVANGDTTVVVSSARMILADEQGFLGFIRRYLGKGGNGFLSCTRGDGFKSFNSHYVSP